MKSFLVNLLILLALILCAFNAVQWYREARLHGTLQQRGEEIFQKASEVQSLQQSLKANLEEIKRLESARELIASALKSNKLAISQIQEESDKFRRDAQIQAAKASQGEQYREAFEKANESLKKQNEIIQVQNDKMKQMADDRNEVVGRFNKLATDYKSLGDDYSKLLGMYTNLVAQVQAANQKSSK